MPDPTNPPPNPESMPVAGADPKVTRRRLLQGGLAAGPVLMTLVSRPVLAQHCATPSGFVSGNASHPGAEVDCTGNGPSYWYEHQSGWPTPYKPQAHFKKYFAPALSLPGDNDPSLLEVLDPSQTTNAVARYCVAALLNAGPPALTPVLSAAAVKGIWSEFAKTGSFSPSSGVHWGASAIVDYLKTTMTTP
jgi:hypothetical protein